ncbi:MAG: type II toxin-antitoxin system RelE/ParE family toxin [Planctomycetaceae bacterium]|nr:type II toxin-antitoxin system RelE/ParE family toxin [Planctomycetaceae bacterium]
MKVSAKRKRYHESRLRYSSRSRGRYFVVRRLSCRTQSFCRLSFCRTIQMLCQNSELEERLHSDPTRQIRYRTILDFRNYLIFYRRVDSVLEIIRILHGARDYDNFSG